MFHSLMIPINASTPAVCSVHDEASLKCATCVFLDPFAMKTEDDVVQVFKESDSFHSGRSGRSLFCLGSGSRGATEAP